MDPPFFKNLSVTLQIAIEPSKSDLALAAVKEKLNNSLFRYSEDLEGVPIIYEDIAIPAGKNYARVFGEYPWLHIDISARITIFKPDIGQVIYGRVNKVSDSHVSLLVFGMFTATISGEKLSASYTYNRLLGRW